MVSTHANNQQYLSDYSPTNPMDNSKSPLAMLAKTCETIGLPDPPTKKLSSPKSKDCSPASSNASGDKKEDMSPTSIKSKKEIDSKSPRSMSVSEKKVFGSEPSTSMCTQFGPAAFPMMTRCFPGMATFPTGAHFGMPFAYPPTGPYGMPPGMQFHGAPGGMPQMHGHHNGRPCVTPGCSTCSPVLVPSSADMMMMPNLAQSFFAAYSNPLLAAGMAGPTTVPSSMASQLAAYQSMMAAACGQNKNVCNFPDTNGQSGHCGKSFATSDELTAHMKSHMITTNAPSTVASSASATTPVNTLSTTTNPAISRSETPKKARASPKAQGIMYANNAAAAMRFHPYMKNPAAAAAAQMMAASNPAALNAAMAASMNGAAGMSPFGMMPPFNPAALQAMYAQQRLMGTIPHH